MVLPQEACPQDPAPLASHAIFAKRMAGAGIRPQDRIAIAVSGGPDSMALCLLAKHWWQHSREAGVYSEKPTGLVVDHGLRPESAAEASQVQRWVTNLGMECHVLKCEWIDGRPDSGHLQESARYARYSLMEQTCWREGIGTLLTGHHADDQAELFMMRMARGSGIIGLAGMAFVSHIFPQRPAADCQAGLLVVRPLLPFAKEDLYKVCKEAGQKWVEDPTNVNRTFARNRIRQALADPLHQDSRGQIQSLIAACRQTRAVLDRQRDKVLAKTVSVSKDFAHVAINVEDLASSGVSEAVLARVLVAILQFVAQKDKPPRGKALKILMDKIQRPPFQEAFTLAGCHVSPAPGSKGTKVMVCLSPDSPTPAMPSDLISWEQGPSEILRKQDLNEAHASETGDADFEEGTQPMLDTRDGSPSVLEQGKELGLVSEGVATLLESLRAEIAETMSKNHEEGRLSEATSEQTVYRPDSRKQLLPLGQSCYFMNRFLVSWAPKAAATISNQSRCMTLSGDQRGRCCLLREKPDAWVRHFEEGDWNQLSQVLKTNLATSRFDKVSSWCVYQYETDLYGGSEERRLKKQLEHKQHAAKRDTSKKARPRISKYSEEAPVYCGGHVTSKAQRALAILRCIPKPVRRGLPVLVNAEGLLLAIPTLGFQRCPWLSVSAIFRPRTPLGGGRASWM